MVFYLKAAIICNEFLLTFLSLSSQTSSLLHSLIFNWSRYIFQIQSSSLSCIVFFFGPSVGCNLVDFSMKRILQILFLLSVPSIQIVETFFLHINSSALNLKISLNPVALFLFGSVSFFFWIYFISNRLWSPLSSFLFIRNYLSFLMATTFQFILIFTFSIFQYHISRIPPPTNSLVMYRLY